MSDSKIIGRLVSLLQSLPEAKAREVEAKIEAYLNTGVDPEAQERIASRMFQELNPPLPEPLLRYAREFCEVPGNTIAAFFAANPEAGRMEDYNLLEFSK